MTSYTTAEVEKNYKTAYARKEGLLDGQGELERFLAEFVAKHGDGTREEHTIRACIHVLASRVDRMDQWMAECAQLLPGKKLQP